MVVPQDAEGNAAALEIYTFLMLKMQDGKTLLTHLCEESETAKKILGSENYRELRAGFLQIFSEDKIPVTNSKIKQVFSLCRIKNAMRVIIYCQY